MFFYNSMPAQMCIVTIMCHNDELSSIMSWVGCILKDSELFILFADNSQILLKISVIPILLTFIYLIALNLFLKTNSTHRPTQLIIVAHYCHKEFEWQPRIIGFIVSLLYAPSYFFLTYCGVQKKLISIFPISMCDFSTSLLLLLSRHNPSTILCSQCTVLVFW